MEVAPLSTVMDDKEPMRFQGTPHNQTLMRFKVREAKIATRSYRSALGRW